MNCEDLIKLVVKIRSLAEKFYGSIEAWQIDRGQQDRDTIKSEWANFYETMVPADRDFVEKVLCDEALMAKISQEEERVHYGKNDDLPIDLSIFPINKNGRLTQASLDRFLKYKNEFHVHKFQVLLRIFLSLYRSGIRPVKIREDDLDLQSNARFGADFSGGNLEIDHIEDSKLFLRMRAGRVKIGEVYSKTGWTDIGTSMRGGLMEIDQATATIGAGIQGGTIVVHALLKGSICPDAQGGTVYVGDYSQAETDNVELCRGSKNVTCLIGNLATKELKIGSVGKGITALIKCKPDRLKKKSAFGDRIACYDEEKDEIVPICLNMQIGTSLLRDFLTHVKFKEGIERMLVHDSKSDIDFSFLEGGIVFLNETLAVNNLGKGMKGGILILDDPKIKSVEEAKARVVSPQQRIGGVILYMKRWTEGKMFKKKRVEFVPI